MAQYMRKATLLTTILRNFTNALGSAERVTRGGTRELLDTTRARHCWI